MALTYGTAGVKQKDYRVYIGLASKSGLADAIATYEGTQNKTNLAAVQALLDELGECRADSIDLGIDDGDSVDGNVLGKIVLNKAAKFTAELINATPANISALEALDGKTCTILMIERDGRVIDATIMKTAILMNNITISYSEKITGGDSIRSTINVEKSVANAGAFRSIHDIDVA